MIGTIFFFKSDIYDWFQPARACDHLQIIILNTMLYKRLLYTFYKMKCIVILKI